MDDELHSISQAARDFINQPEPMAPYNLSDVKRLREQEHKLTIETNRAFIGSLVETPEVIELAGVWVQQVTPKNYQNDSDNRCVFYLFGGAFALGSPDVDIPITAVLASHLGVKIIAPYYRRAPEYSYPAALNDALAVYQSIVNNSQIKQFAVVGESAGGNLSLALMLRARELGLRLPSAAVLLSPWCDLTKSSESQNKPTGFDPTLDHEMHLKQPSAAYAGGISLNDPRISPLYADYAADFPATLITSGTRDFFVSDCRRLVEKMKAASVDAQLNVWPGMWHVFEWYSQIPEAGESLKDIAKFIADRFTPG